MKSNWRQLNYDELYVPPVLYKYRTWSNPWHKTVLTNRELYLAAPSTFEDPLDCKVPDRYDLLTDEDLYKRFLKHSYTLHPHYNETQRHAFAEHWVKHTPLKDPVESKKNQQKIFEDFDRQIGVLCLTANPQRFEMWEKYADGHKGYCVGFHGKELFSDHERFGFTGDVEYMDTLPIIHPDEELLDKAFKKVFSKLKHWEFEEEYRTTKIMEKPKNNDWRTVPVDSKKYVEIVFGAEISKSDKDEITLLATSSFPNIKLRQSEVNLTSKAVTIKDIT
jgi:hypothetical protein